MIDMIDLKPLESASRLLFTVPLKPVQGDRFQPTGFPNLGAATYQTKDGAKLLVESAQSMANRLETTCWDINGNKPVAPLAGISHVTVTRKGKFLTDSMLEAHRINSPYILNGKTNGAVFFDVLGGKLNAFETGTIDRKSLAEEMLRFDVGSLIHGLFLSAKINNRTLAGGRLRVARALSAFIEATGVRVAASGGVKNDHVNPSGDTKTGFGNVPFSRDEFTAESIDCHVNLDLAQIRGYGLGESAERLLILLALYRLRRLFDGDMRLRTACDLEPVNREKISANRPAGFVLPSLTDLEKELPGAIEAGKELMNRTTVAFEDELKKGKDTDDAAAPTADNDQDATEDAQNEKD